MLGIVLAKHTVSCLIYSHCNFSNKLPDLERFQSLFVLSVIPKSWLFDYIQQTGEKAFYIILSSKMMLLFGTFGNLSHGYCFHTISLFYLSESTHTQWNWQYWKLILHLLFFSELCEGHCINQRSLKEQK